MPARRVSPASLLLAAALAACCSCARGPQVSEGDVSARVGEGLPLGSTRAQAERFLDSLEIDGLKAERGRYVTPYAVASDPRVRGYLGGCVCGNSPGLFERDCVCAMLYFDESEKLINYQVEAFDRR